MKCAEICSQVTRVRRIGTCQGFHLRVHLTHRFLIIFVASTRQPLRTDGTRRLISEGMPCAVRFLLPMLLLPIENEQRSQQHHAAWPNVEDEAAAPKFAVRNEFEEGHSHANDHEPEVFVLDQ